MEYLYPKIASQNKNDINTNAFQLKNHNKD